MCLLALTSSICHFCIDVCAGMIVSVMLAMKKRRTEEANRSAKAEVGVEGIRSDPDVEC